MKDDRRIGRLYEGLTAKQRASLILRFCSVVDKQAADQVHASVPLRQYGPMPDWETTSAIGEMTWAIVFFGMESWRYTAGYVGALGSAAAADRRGDPEGAELALSQMKIAQGRLLALDGVLKTFLARTGLDAGVVHCMTGATPFSAMGENCLRTFAERNGLDASEVRKGVGEEAFSCLVPTAKPDKEYQAGIESLMCGWMG
jgi:hypothetical protein